MDSPAVQWPVVSPTDSLQPVLTAYRDWPPEAVALIERAVARHGGWECWRKLDSLSMRPTMLRSRLPQFAELSSLKPSNVTVHPKSFEVKMLDFPRTGLETEYDRGSLKVFELGSTKVLDESPFHGARFRAKGLKRLARWNALDVAWFFGQAVTTYFGLPFILPICEYISTISGRVANLRLKGIRVRFPREWPSHSRVQSFYFDESGLLLRHDYVSDAIGKWAHGAHLSSSYIDVNGMQVSTERKVLCRFGRWITRLPVLDARMADVSMTTTADYRG